MSTIRPVARAATIWATRTATVVDRTEPLAIVGSAEQAGSQSASRSTASAGHRAHSWIAHFILKTKRIRDIYRKLIC